MVCALFDRLNETGTDCMQRHWKMVTNIAHIHTLAANTQWDKQIHTQHADSCVCVCVALIYIKQQAHSALTTHMKHNAGEFAAGIVYYLFHVVSDCG